MKKTRAQSNLRKRLRNQKNDRKACRNFFAACLGLSFAMRFFGVALAPDFFAVVLRTDEVLRVLLRTIDFRFLAVARFFP